MKKESKNLIIFLAATFVWTWARYAPIKVQEPESTKSIQPMLSH